MGRRWKGRKQLLGDLKKRRGYCKLNDEVLDRTMWRTGFGRVCGPVVRETDCGMVMSVVVVVVVKMIMMMMMMMSYHQCTFKK